jgi:glucose-1-phosphate cytidylyltransferase
MKAVILAGGLGTRLSEETTLKPKPLVNVGEMPIIWHIMKYYSHFGIKDFIICLGYKGYQIKNFFLNQSQLSGDIKVNIKDNNIKRLNKSYDDWNIILAETGLETNTAGRIRKIKKYLKGDDFFFLTYGDGLTNSNLKKTLNLHIRKKKSITVTAVKALGRFGGLKINNSNLVTAFSEKSDKIYINGGYFILSRKVIDVIRSNEQSFEKDILPIFLKKKDFAAYKHDGFWQCMDNFREKEYLNKLWKYKKAPWKIWK